MGRRQRAAISAWAEDLIDRHGPAVATVIGLAPPPPAVPVDVTPRPGVASTDGTTITLHEPWFREHPDDEGCVIHELSHAYLRAPEYSGMDTSWSFAHFEPEKATAGYQTTAHFLAWLEQQHPGAVAALARRLAEGTYDEGVFAAFGGEHPLPELVAAYEAAQSP